MTFAVINTGGKQYKVSANDKLRIEKLPQEEGKSIEFKEVLLINNNQDMELGSPLIDGAKVEGKIVKQTKNKTVLIFNIIYRQRGTKMYPGQNVGMGRDHTIFSKIEGTVKFQKKKFGKTFISVVPH